MIGREHEIEQPRVVEAVAEAQDARARRHRRGRPAVEQHHRDLGAGVGARNHRDGQRARVPWDEVEVTSHQKTRYRWARRASSATAPASTGTIGWPSTFHSASLGIVPTMWNGTLSFRRAARNFAMSSPSTRSSVSSSSRWTAGPVSTTITSFSPATTPRAMRIASLARWDARGSSEMTTSTGRPSATASVQGDEAVGAADHVGEHHEAAVGGAVRQGKTPLLAAVGAHEEAGAALRESLHARVLHGGHAVVDEVEVHLRAAIERGVPEPERGSEVGVLGRGRDHEAELFPRGIHGIESVASR